MEGSIERSREKELSFEQALKQLQKIADLVQKKDLTLVQSLDLLEEGVYLANLCTEKIDENIWQKENYKEEEFYE